MRLKLESPFVIVVLALLFFIPFLGNVHLFDWDEINFAESAREMLISGNYLRVQIDFQPFWEKPPLFIWLQTLSMTVFGINEFAARFPNALMGIVTLLTFFYIGKRLIDARFGFLWALAYLGSVTPHLYFKSGIIDPTFNYFMFLSVIYLIPNPTNHNQSVKKALLAGLFAGLAVWTKGPVGIGIPTIVLGVMWATNRFKPIMTLKQLLAYSLTAGLISLAWVGLLIYESGWQTFLAFLQYLVNLSTTSEADHGQPFYYHFVVVLIGCFPISVLGLRYIFSRQSIVDSGTPPGRQDNLHENISGGLSTGRRSASDYRPLTTSMQILFWVVMIVFSVVKTKIVHYSSMAYFPLSFLAALYVYRWIKNEIEIPKWTVILLLIVGFILSLLLVAVPLIGMYASLVSPYIDDKFVVANLQAPVEWAGYEWTLGIIYFFVIVYVARSVWVLRKFGITNPEQQLVGICNADSKSGGFTIHEKRKYFAIKLLFFSTAILLFCYTAIVVPKIEGYTQRTVIDFYESKRGQDVYVFPVGFKSYAQFFYFKKPVNVRKEARNENWLLNGAVDKPVYLVARIDRAEAYYQHPNLELIKEENGFVFFKRVPNFLNLAKTK